MHDAGQNRSEDGIVLEFKELPVSRDVLERWREAADRSAVRAAEQAAVIALAFGMGFATVLAVLVESNRIILIGAFAPIAVGLTWFYAWLILRRLLTGPVARQMRDTLIPALVTRASWDELLRFARLGIGGFTHDSTIIRTERREDAIYLVARKYDLSKGEWFLPEGFGMGTSGAAGGGGG